MIVHWLRMVESVKVGVDVDLMNAVLAVEVIKQWICFSS